ncbi:DUF5810 domain-containing protein [Halorientalis salina]|uniref:DUF5810 domain-containing protein n=1 Tax=Halorientalis salina TaxID=2932266 RepID=UPI0010AD164F|nr:DUF5810 domain-containing protein [Halorientalis salina]
MGYACPVCGDPQSDAEHLANHLAFTAMLGNADHEAWLDEHAPDWQESDADALADTVSDLAEDAEFPQVFEDTVDRRETGGGARSSDATGDHDHDHDHGRDPASERSGALFDDEPQFAADARDRAERDRELDDQAERILQEAQQMTERMLDDDADDGDEAETE